MVKQPLDGVILVVFLGFIMGVGLTTLLKLDTVHDQLVQMAYEQAQLRAAIERIEADSDNHTCVYIEVPAINYRGDS